MSRRLRIATYEIGPIEAYVIYSKAGQWEKEWQPLQGESITSLLTYVGKSVYDHALHGWSAPLVTTLGLAPAGCLQKIPDAGTSCVKEDTCPMFDAKACFPRAKALPWCYEPNISVDEQKRLLASEIIRLWREKVYVIVVEE
jgi:hypothetical protein